MQSELDSLQGWAVVAAALVATTVLLGISYSFGVLVEPVAAEFDTGRGGAAPAFALTVALPFLLAPLTGRLGDRHGPRPLLGAAAVVSTAGLLGCAHSTSAWTFHLSFGLGVGAGAACAFVPMVAAVGGWFVRRRTLALAIALAGSGAGTVAGAPLIASLVEAHGLRSACLALAGVTAVSIPLAAALAARPPCRPGPAPASAGNRGFARLYLAGAAGSVSALIPLAFMVPSAIDRGVAAADAALLLAFAGASNVGARLLVPLAVSRLGLLRSYRVSFVALAASGPLWMAAGRSLPALTASACLLGAGYGAFVALSPAVAADVLGTAALGRRLGALYTSAGVGALAGPLFAGAAIDMTGGYLAAVALAATAGAIGALAVRSSLHVVSGIGC